MDKKLHRLLLIPTVIFPYIIVVFGTLFSLELIKAADETVWGWAILADGLLAIVCNIIYMALSRNRSRIEFLRAALAVKAAHIPTYAVIFVCGLIAGMMIIMTFPLIIMFVLIDAVTLFLSGILSVGALIKAANGDQGLSRGITAVAIICQFFFCADIISLLVVYLNHRAKR